MRAGGKRLARWLGTIALFTAIVISGALPAPSASSAMAALACAMPCCQGLRTTPSCCADRVTLVAKPTGCGCEIRASSVPSNETAAFLTAPPALSLPRTGVIEPTPGVILGDPPVLPHGSPQRIRSPDASGHPLRAPPIA